MQLEKEFDSKKIEQLVRSHLSGIDLQKMLDQSKTKQRLVFIEGPPTMNGIPHAGHLRGRIIKDLWYRYNTLKGHKITFNAGWDTQGLPVELQAEKELGITGGKTEILKTFGIEKIVAECKKLVHKYNEKWIEVDKLLGMSFNQKDAYWTYKDEFIEREWQFLKKAHEIGVLTEGYRVVAYCPSCQTSLSHAEVNQGYDLVQDPSLYYKVKLESEDAFLIVWTTMPFTLVTDAMVGLNPEENYHYVQVQNETWVIGEKRLEEFAKEVKLENYSITKTVKGATFEGKKYIHPLLKEIPKVAELAKSPLYHVAIADDFVDPSTGSGLVHLAPANGEEDYNIAQKRKTPIFSPIDDEVKFTADAGKYSGMFVRDADRPLVEDLKANGALVKIGRIKHKYPLCWRSHHPIVWLARREFFYMLDRLEDKAIQAAESVEYFFDQPKNRFLGIIKEKHPWCISRERFWGCPLPIWNCKCGHVERLFSRKEIVQASTDLPDGPNFELHRPWIDRVVIKCKKCGAQMEREKFVLDTWHNSGSAPYSSLSDGQYSEGIPAPFLTEGIDQTRGWAYTLLIENVILNNKPVSPYSAFLFQGHVLDKNGNKMSKSLGNVMDGQEMLNKYPVDLIRFYFIWKSSPIEPINFSTEELMSRPYQIINTLYHIHLYYKQNSDYDKFDESTHTVQWAKQKGQISSPDIWILSKLQKMISAVGQNNDTCKFHESARALEDFIINSLSQVYIPITKAELWDDDNSKTDRRYAIYSVLHKILKTLDVLIHPLCPYTSEYLYLTVFGKDSVLLQEWPTIDSELVNDTIEESFDLMKESVSISSAARMKAKLKRRWPLTDAVICVLPGQKKMLESLSDLLVAQMNVESFKCVELQNKSGLELLAEMESLKLPARPVIEMDRKKIGPKAKQHMGALLAAFANTKPEQIVESLHSQKYHVFDVGAEKITLDLDDFIIGFDAKDGYAYSQRDSLIVFISTSRNREMMARGLVKDLARRLQTLRKEQGYNPTDVLSCAHVLDLDPESLEMAKEKSKDLAFLVRVKTVDFDSAPQTKDDDIDGQKIRIWIE
ncbi:MAG TPA: isoleucine--tRNA ligase [Candidatus Nitrosotenuis sp.]|nr:isoleucine--tRNA ligase [Candidatus Nitrosotenuis sp.]